MAGVVVRGAGWIGDTLGSTKPSDSRVFTSPATFNKHFLFPLTILYGRRRVLHSLLEMTTDGTEFDSEQIEGALYWLSIPREQTHWPHHYKHPVYRPPADEPIDDLLRRFDLVLRARRERRERTP